MRQRRADDLARLGLPWPHPRKKVGKPTDQPIWEDALYARMSRGEAIPVTVPRDRPARWRPGLPLEEEEACVIEEVRSVPAGREEAASQTALRLLPTADFAWSSRGNGAERALLVNDKTNITSLLAVGTKPDLLLQQLIFAHHADLVSECV